MPIAKRTRQTFSERLTQFIFRLLSLTSFICHDDDDVLRAVAFRIEDPQRHQALGIRVQTTDRVLLQGGKEGKKRKD